MKRPRLDDLPDISDSMRVRISCITEKEARELPFSPARRTRDAWIPRLVWDLYYDGGIDTDDDDEDKLIEHIAHQCDRCEHVYVTIRRGLRERDSPCNDRLAERLSVFRALCAHIADLERAELRAAFASADDFVTTEAALV